MKRKIYFMIPLVCILIGFLFVKSNFTFFANHKDLTREQAVAVVNNLPDIVAWKKLFTDNGKGPKTGGVPVVEVGVENEDSYEVDAYEHIEEDGWWRNPREGTFYVNKKTGEITKEPDIEYK